MLKSKSNGSLIIISGPSGTGKGTICSELLKQNQDIYSSISVTSRSKRGEEQDGREYNFVTKEKFEKMIHNNELLEYAIVHGGEYYGTPKDKVEKNLNEGKDVLLEIDIQGALKVKDKFPEGIFIFIMPPTMKELVKRLINRHTESKEKILERFKNAYKEINEIKKYNYVVVNDDLEEAVKKVEAIIISEKCRVDRIEDVDLDNQEEVIHEMLVDFEKED